MNTRRLWGKVKSVLRRIKQRVGFRSKGPRRYEVDAFRLLAAEEVNAYYEAQRRAARARVLGNRKEAFHWANVAAEIASRSPSVEMDVAAIEKLVTAEIEKVRGG